MTAATMTGTCECGDTVERGIVTGLAADLLNDLPFTCDPCYERAEADRERLEHAEQRERAKRDAAQRLANCGLPLNLRAIELDALDRTGCGEAIDAARQWATHGGGLVLTGPFGIGKTTIAAGALRLRLEQGRRGRWASAPLLMAHLGSGFDTPQRQGALHTLTGSRSALVLDDADKVRPTEYGAEQVFLAVDGAVTNDRPLLLTTNLSVGELAAKWPQPYGEAIVSRIVGFCQVVPLTGTDRRLEPVPSTPNGRAA
jgi:DNA replication protein DnaC